MKDPTRPHPDLDAVLRQVPTEEAARLRAVWDLAGPEEPTAVPDMPPAEAAYERLQAALAPPTNGVAHPAAHRSRTSRSPARQHRGRWQIGVALAAVLIVGLLGAFWWMQPITHTALPGERLALILPDGSQVELNSGATLHYTRRFGAAARRVTLHGEAFFDVVPGSKTFVVETSDAEVQVLGTRFNVRAWGGRLEHGTTVALETGRVLLVPTVGEAAPVTLAPGETRRVFGGTAGLLDAPDLSVKEATAWRRGDFVMKDQFVGAMLDEIERRFDVRIVVEPATLRQRRYHMTRRQPADAEAIVHDLAGALGLHYRETADGFALSPR